MVKSNESSNDVVVSLREATSVMSNGSGCGPIAGPDGIHQLLPTAQEAEIGLRYLTFDDELTLLSAQEDPVGMIRNRLSR